MENNSRPTQCERVMHYLNKYGSITQDIAEKEFGCRRLPSRIFELTDMGYKFNTIKEAGKNRYGEPCYWTRYFVPKKEVIGYARINNWGQSYSTYDSWVEKNAPEYLSQYKNSRIKANWEAYEYFNGRAGEILSTI